MQRLALTMTVVCALALALAARTASPQDKPDLDVAELEARGAVIGRINIDVDNVFDLSNPEEDRKLYRWANRVHMTTRPSTVQDVLLIKTGDPFDPRLLEESARALRSVGFIAEADLKPSAYDESTNEVTVDVTVRDAWSLSPELKASRSGGKNEYALGVSEDNLFGFGKKLTVAYRDDVDRAETYFGYSDPNVRGSRTRFDVALANRSDGDRQAFTAERPFYALDSHWSVGSAYDDDRRVDSMYELGEVFDEFRHDTNFLSVRGGLSSGLRDNRTRRLLLGLNYEEDEFLPTVEVPDPLLLPQNRKLVYPWFGVQIIEDRFLEVSELNDMGRTEDVQLGLGLTARVGYADTGLGSDRNAAIFDVRAHKGWEPGGSGRLLLLDSQASTRLENGSSRNTIVSTSFRYYRRNLGRNLFSVSLAAVAGKDLDAENQILIGGDNGLRGFPLRYQSGKRSMTLTLEQRFYTDWYPMRLIRVGYAIFLDTGRVWGRDARDARQLGLLSDIGIGLRLTSPKSTAGSVVHIDLAFPINAAPDIDNVQLIVERKRSF